MLGFVNTTAPQYIAWFNNVSNFSYGAGADFVGTEGALAALSSRLVAWGLGTTNTTNANQYYGEANQTLSWRDWLKGPQVYAHNAWTIGFLPDQAPYAGQGYFQNVEIDVVPSWGKTMLSHGPVFSPVANLADPGNYMDDYQQFSDKNIDYQMVSIQQEVDDDTLLKLLADLIEKQRIDPNKMIFRISRSQYLFANSVNSQGYTIYCAFSGIRGIGEQRWA